MMADTITHLSAVPTLLMAGVLFGVFLIAGVGIAWLFDGYRRRIPQAVLADRLDARVAESKEQLTDLEGKISAARQILGELDKNKAEAEFWADRVARSMQEWNEMGDRRAELERLQEEVRDAVEAAAEKRDEFTKLEREIEEARQGLGDSQRRIDIIETTTQSKKAELEAVQSEIERNRPECEDARRTLKEAEEARQHLQRRSGELDDLVHRLEVTRAELETLGGTRYTVKSEVDEGKKEADKLQELVNERARELKALTEKRDERSGQIQRAEARLAALDAEMDKRKHSGTDVEKALVLGELRKAPDCLTGPNWSQPLGKRDEISCLENVGKRLEAQGLHFSRRVIRAFHTALKVNDISPMTVLAGISGTGKSQLPRLYAEAMGIHFLQVPVQPRWDSPQDLMGFYNYIERRYRATDLARALVHLDQYNWNKESEPWRDRMMLVLLDEMNLARVEYYFSEFLSRLEMRPSVGGEGESTRRMSAEIPIDVPGDSDKDQDTWRIYPGHRILFAGTMNEDESTQSLSDKVLDRSNLLRFPKPRELREQSGGAPSSIGSSGFLQWSQWSEWVRSFNHQRNPRDDLKHHIAKLNDICEGAGRAFGHRMGQAIAAYVVNYPQGGMSVPLADQVEMRIIPKLRGLDVGLDSSRVCIDALARFARDDLTDEELGDAIEQARNDSQDRGGLFVWPGFQRESADLS